MLAATLSTGLVLAACGDDGKSEVKGIKEQVQRAYGAKDFAKALALSQKGLAVAREKMGDTAPDTLYFVQGISEANLSLHNMRGAIAALKTELAMRAAAKQPESKLQARRTMLIQLAQENGDVMTAGDQAVIVARGIDMAPGKDPQPVYKAPLNPQTLPRGEGDIEISYGLDAAGNVTGAQVSKGTPPMVFDQAALEAFNKWRFTPMLDKSGRPVSASGFKFTMMIRQR